MSVAGHKPPPFFKQGIAPLAKLFIYVSAALLLLTVDLRFRTLEAVRVVLGAVIYPIQGAAQIPVDILDQGSEYFTNHTEMREEISRLHAKELESSSLILRQEHLEMENQRLRALLDLKNRQKTQSVVAEVVSAARDPFSRKIFIDKGLQQGIQAGQAVVDEAGVLGQITRVFPLSSEITLLTDKDQTIPVQVLRNGLRTVLAGAGSGQMELRYLAGNADVGPGDIVVTSGLDGIYLPGLPVAKVTYIDRDNAYAFARILCEPLAGVERNNQVLVLGNREPVVGVPVEEPTDTNDKKMLKGKRAKRPKVK